MSFPNNFNRVSGTEAFFLARNYLGRRRPFVRPSPKFMATWMAACRPEDAVKLSLFALVRYPFMEPRFLAERVEPILTPVAGGRDLLFEAYRCKLR